MSKPYNTAKLEQEMRRRGWTKLELSRRANVGVATVQRIFEVGSGHPRNIKKIGKVLGFSLEDLMNSETAA